MVWLKFRVLSHRVPKMYFLWPPPQCTKIFVDEYETLRTIMS
jgi:hypothetical protein